MKQIPSAKPLGYKASQIPEASRGMPHAIIGFADLSEPDAPELIARHAEHANWRGIRHMLNWAEDPKWQFTDRNDLMTDADWLRGYRALADHDGSFDLQGLAMGNSLTRLV